MRRRSLIQNYWWKIKPSTNFRFVSDSALHRFLNLRQLLAFFARAIIPSLPEPFIPLCPRLVIQTHNVKPEHLLTYLDLYEEFTALMANRHNGLKLVGSFLVEVGDQVRITIYERMRVGKL